ncbi:tripartite tricarboxylate transporter substrate binding protein [Ramlibacter sp. G-1-2-2]|uniref:Tripartite tricarboxylate transporter substrate binding protein n=1 Tax=Ramlibacter agri TaxID=2728837 RepID=A0A848HAR1_9BURK|nr:tripartite tricarboxylate transporter substrate binding protein [Ramlibacter agri]NML47564.1 tripartite tricarboxylate transporter substrate binding protein [Ramlibacter agri]
MKLRAALLLATVLGAAHAQDYPSKPIHLVVGYAPGGAWDILARQLQPRLTEALGQPVIVENKAGANGIIGSDYVAKAAPDGYTLLLAGLTPLVLNSLTYPKLPYNATSSFVGISTIATTPILFVVKPDVPAKTLPELVAASRAKPDSLTFATVGTGGSTRVVFELFKRSSGAEVRYIPYKAVAQGMTELLAGMVDAMAIDLPVLYPRVKDGKLRAIAITSEKRNPLLPDVPTAAEQGLPALTAGNWYALLAPAKTPRPVVDKLHAALTRVLTQTDLKDQLLAGGVEPMAGTPESYNAFLAAELARWGKVVKEAHIESE